MSAVRLDGRRLQSRRLERLLTTAELAQQAGLAYRTVLDLERGRRTSVEELTVSRLADALGCAPDDLRPAGGGEGTARVGSPRPAPSLRLLPLLACVIVLPGALLVRQASHPPLPDLEIEAGALIARHPSSGREVWQFSTESPVTWLKDTPWGDDLVLAGLDGEAPDGGRVVLLRRRSGDLVWGFRPSLADAFDAFPAPLQERTSLVPTPQAFFLDLDGGGEEELAALFNHFPFYPFWVAFLDRQGRELGTYLHRGYLYGPLAADLDGDGDEEFLSGGTNNSKALQGATLLILDRERHVGVSLDTVSGDTVCLPDSARVRLVLPSFGEPWMTLLGIERLEARKVRLVRDDAGVMRIHAVVQEDSLCTLTLDAELRPLAAEPTEHLRVVASTWPAPHTGGGPADPTWLRAWLGRALRFEAGHYPPRPCPAPPPARGI